MKIKIKDFFDKYREKNGTLVGLTYVLKRSSNQSFRTIVKEDRYGISRRMGDGSGTSMIDRYFLDNIFHIEVVRVPPRKRHHLLLANPPVSWVVELTPV